MLQLRVAIEAGQLQVHWSNYETGTGGGGNFSGNGLVGNLPSSNVFAQAVAAVKVGDVLVRTAKDATSPAMLSGWVVKYEGRL